MRINIVYKAGDSRGDSLCFICAVQMAALVDAKKNNIFIEEYAHYDETAKCVVCGKYLDDSITI